MGWTYSYVKGQTLWDIPGCLTHPLETDKWDGQVGQWQVPLSLEKGMSHFPNGQSMAMLDMCVLSKLEKNLTPQLDTIVVDRSILG